MRPGAGPRLRQEDRRRDRCRRAERSDGDRRVSRRRGRARAEGRQVTSPLLELKSLQVAYGGIQAVKGIDLVVRERELVCLIGANGAGKTTTLKGITGLQPVKSGTIRYADEDITGKPAFELVRKGLSMVPEGRGVFGALTIEENLAMGAYARSDRAAIRDDVERVFGLFPRLKERHKQTAGTLSGGEQQMLAMGRALMSRPKLLLLDEAISASTSVSDPTISASTVPSRRLRTHPLKARARASSASA